MVILLDTNIILDYLLKREPFYENSRKIMELCSNTSTDGCIALHTVTTIWYILRRIPDSQRRTALKSVCNLLQVVGTTHEEVIKAIDAFNFKDFEDCIQTKCAKYANAQYIITRNIDDFRDSEIPTLTPQELLSNIK